ncbi:MAG: hypothetical protein A2075_08490 [Geobacteraceae bacterium GWC2_58_44]|nr:MAG: hypothetical protein A2075_08490 [Geobacteraceae bacterium GWC2_58_44]
MTGYTVAFDPDRQAYFYAERSADGKSLLSTGVLAHHPAPTGLAKHLRIDPAAAAAAARARREKWHEETGLSKRWSRLKSETLHPRYAPGDPEKLPAPPPATTTGNKVGLTLLIDFPDAPATISKTEIEAYLNGDSYSGFGNYGSVKQYFNDVSGSRLSYTNVVTTYVRMTKPKSYYNNTTIDNGRQGRLLITDALAILKARSDYSSTILPSFNALTTDGSGYVLAFNVFFAGYNSGVWGNGLWPHSWVLTSPITLGNGKSVFPYQITDLGSSLELGTFCHENGHMLCGFPDIYDYDQDSIGGAGVFCLMNSGGLGTNPSQVGAYLKLAAGWATATDLGAATLTGSLVAAPNNGYDKLYRYRRPGVDTEYFLLENRQKTGRDAILPGGGIAVWHVDELGDKDDQSLAANPSHLNYEVTLVQADNRWDFQNNVNPGDRFDLYYQGNDAAGYAGRLDDASTPHARWWDGSASGMSLGTFSAPGMSMSFKSEPGGGGLPAPLLAAEPAVTPGATNTISWSQVSPGGVNPPAAGSLPNSAAAFNSEVSGGRDAVSGAGLEAGSPPISLPGAVTARQTGQSPAGEHQPAPARATLPPGRGIVAPDQGGKMSSAPGPLSATSIWSESFEGSFPGTGWQLYGNPTWGATGVDKYAGSRSGWCGTSGLAPENGYGNDMNAWMLYGPFSLAGSSGAGMSFWYKNLSESGHDYFRWMASVDGEDYYGYQVSGDHNSWRSKVFDLSNVPTLGNLNGKTQVWLAFQFVSDGTDSGPAYQGAYIDDIAISNEAGGSADLAVYKPSNWNNTIPVGTSLLGQAAAHSSAGPYYNNQTLYFNWAAVNQGTATASPYKVHLEVTGTGGGSWDWGGPSTGPGQWVGLENDRAFGPLAAGAHTLKLWIDHDGAVGESDEANNYYERTITVVPAIVEPVQYYAERADNAGFASPADSGWTTQRQWTFSGLTLGRGYWYRVKAKSGLTEGGWSNVEHSLQENLPTISGTPATTVAAGSPYSFTPTATRAVSLGIQNKPPWASFHTGTGALTGTPTNADADTYSNIVISASNAAGTASLPPFSITVSASAPTLSVVLSGSGGGNVNSSPTGIACVQGSNADCSATFAGGSIVALLATANGSSTFGGWSGACQGAGACSVSMTTDRTVDAAFNAAPNVKVGDASYQTLQAACTAAGDGATVRAREMEFVENLVFGHRQVRLKGGYNAPFSSNDGHYTIIRGSLKLRNGPLRVDKILIR